MQQFVYFLLMISLANQSFSQYSNNIDSLSKKEIKNLILELEPQSEMRIKLNRSKNGKAIGVFLFASGAMLLSTINNSNSDSDEADINSIYKRIFGSAISISGIITFLISNNHQKQIINEYKTQHKTSEASFIREETKGFKPLNPTLH